MTSEPANTGIITSSFRPARWLRNRHAQTIFPSLPWAWNSHPELRRESLELPDGDVTAVDWLVDTDQVPDSAPLLIILHGLEGSAKSSYARMLMEAARDRGWRACVLHFRDCGDYRNRLPRRYHAGETNDLRHFLRQLDWQRNSDGRGGPIIAVGYSLGGNVLLKYLGESGVETTLQAAVAVCAPLDLHECAEALNIGFSKTYQRLLLNNMKKAMTQKFNRHTAAFNWDRAMRATTFADFDDAVTAPLHGFSGKQDYYDRCSAKHYLRDIQRPTLIINALDDPFMTPDIVPGAEELSAQVTLELADNGGHVGFISGGRPWRPEFYLPGRIIQFLEPHVARPGL